MKTGLVGVFPIVITKSCGNLMWKRIGSKLKYGLSCPWICSIIAHIIMFVKTASMWLYFPLILFIGKTLEGFSAFCYSYPYSVVRTNWAGANSSRTVQSKTSEFYRDIWTDISTAVPDMTSPAVSRRMQNMIEYCVKVHKTGPTDTEANNSATVWRKITINDMQNVCSDFHV